MQAPQQLHAGAEGGKKRKRDDDDEQKVTKRRAQPELQQYHELINILVGPAEHLFQIHKEKLCSKSKYFSAALKNDWIEARRQQVKLPEITTEAFQHYFNWVYSNTVYTEPAVHISPEHSAKIHILYIDMYTMAQYLQDIPFCNAVMDCFIDFSRVSGNAPQAEVCQYIERTAPHERLRQCVVDMLVWRVDAEWFIKDLEAWPQAMINQMFKVLMLDPNRELEDRTCLKRRKMVYHEKMEGHEGQRLRIHVRA